MTEIFESVLCVKQEVFVYRIPARISNRGYRAADWKLDEPDWTGRLKVISKNRDLSIRLEDKSSGELFALSPIESYPSEAVEQVLDSSRYFVVRIQDGNGRNAFIGLGFADRADSFDLLVALQDHFKHVKREEQQVIESAAELESPTATAAAKLDLSFKEGQTIKLNFPTKKSGEMDTPKSKSKGSSATPSAFLPPPPGGTKVTPIISHAPKAPTPNHAPISAGAANLDLLVNISPSDSKGGESWRDFASAAGKTDALKSSEQLSANSWVNFD